jgi:hypothetical protein
MIPVTLVREASEVWRDDLAKGLLSTIDVDSGLEH